MTRIVRNCSVQLLPTRSTILQYYLYHHKLPPSFKKSGFLRETRDGGRDRHAGNHYDDHHVMQKCSTIRGYCRNAGIGEPKFRDLVTENLVLNPFLIWDSIEIIWLIEQYNIFLGFEFCVFAGNHYDSGLLQGCRIRRAQVQGFINRKMFLWDSILIIWLIDVFWLLVL